MKSVSNVTINKICVLVMSITFVLLITNLAYLVTSLVVSYACHVWDGDWRAQGFRHSDNLVEIFWKLEARRGRDIITGVSLPGMA